MVKKCDKCGKELTLFGGTWVYTGREEKLEKLYICKECEEKLLEEKLKREGKIDIEEIKKKSTEFKQDISRSDLSLPELQLQELKQIKTDIHTITNIVIIWFIIGLIGLILSIVTWMAIS